MNRWPFTAAGLLLLALALAPQGLLNGFPTALTRAGADNPHGRAGTCESCHGRGATPKAETFRATSCAACHDSSAHWRRIHAHNIAPLDIRVPDDFPLINNLVECRTCHVMACQPDGRGVPTSLRGSPYADPVEFCYRCHNRADYTGLYPHGTRLPLPPQLLARHRQLKDPLESELMKCSVCHTGVTSRFGVLQAKVGAVRAPGTELCRSCHFDRRHQYRHLGVALWQNNNQPESIGRLAAFQRKWRVRLPLLEGTKIGCTTCHIASPSCGASLMSSDSLAVQSLLRVSRKVICTVCHDEM